MRGIPLQSANGHKGEEKERNRRRKKKKEEQEEEQEVEEVCRVFWCSTVLDAHLKSQNCFLFLLQQ